jgi:hypothetical protein
LEPLYKKHLLTPTTYLPKTAIFHPFGKIWEPWFNRYFQGTFFKRNNKHPSLPSPHPRKTKTSPLLPHNLATTKFPPPSSHNLFTTKFPPKVSDIVFVLPPHPPL